MQLRLAIAISFSILLISGAYWLKSHPVEEKSPNLIAIQETLSQDSFDSGLIGDFIDLTKSTSTKVTQKLTGSDIVGQKLIMDYVALAANGQATDETITALAEQYISSLPTLNSPPTITYADLKIVSNTRNNFQNYADAVTQIYGEYARQISAARTGKNDLDTLNPALYSFALTFSTAYANAATKLKNISVPTALVTAHLKLVNSYLSSTVAMEAISKTEDDSAAAFIGLITLNENISKEDAILNEIAKILNSNGI